MDKMDGGSRKLVRVRLLTLTVSLTMKIDSRRNALASAIPKTGARGPVHGIGFFARMSAQMVSREVDAAVVPATSAAAAFVGCKSA